LKRQIILIFVGILLVASIFFFGRTTSNKKDSASLPDKNALAKIFDVQQFISNEKAKLSTSQSLAVSKIENSISRGDVLSQKIKANTQLAYFWKDSVKSFELYAFYLSAASKLENSEKTLTFAAQLFLDNLRGEKNEEKLNWETTEAIDLFERAIKLNPENDNLKVGLGSCYIYGKGQSGNPQETMKGIQALLAVVRKDSTNMKAQMILGVGGLVSGQFEKAIPRLQKVVEAEPKNVEAIAYLADAYAGKGNKAEAIKWYNISKQLINDKHYTEEVEQRIKALK
jgi:tetratricopeptide (TPR) repeat protein